MSGNKADYAQLLVTHSVLKASTLFPLLIIWITTFYFYSSKYFGYLTHLWRSSSSHNASMSGPLTCARLSLLCLIRTHLQWPLSKKKKEIQCFEHVQLQSWHRWYIFDAYISELSKRTKKKKKRQCLTIFFTSWHCIFFFIFLFISYKILECYTLIL